MLQQFKSLDHRFGGCDNGSVLVDLHDLVVKPGLLSQQGDPLANAGEKQMQFRGPDRAGQAVESTAVLGFACE